MAEAEVKKPQRRSRKQHKGADKPAPNENTTKQQKKTIGETRTELPNGLVIVSR